MADDAISSPTALATLALAAKVASLASIGATTRDSSVTQRDPSAEEGATKCRPKPSRETT
eukprot:CAMPEP_0175831610 /NCGR_PEP_ID=MMETSP0107_2-20121207/14543_1 /TAXON_ID=195067 ORGANISM="Goniomonas pacifica, Strain CCMP1869" /NCGR_SAMPLE_ID=MMETSP0107_2 /ASSEMBLY_ACC=CAM_ASM_000203 /LENGTH=59 /DNA_ID=CAMNT_0017144633 /DNA_START=149 /DNA_END=328 /DNA_ORIENTATION=-